MAAVEARGDWQQAANRRSVQEDVWRAPKSSRCPSSSSKFESDGNPDDASKGSDHPVPGCIPDNQKYSNSELRPETKWWLHLQPNYGHPKNYSKEQLNALEAEYGVYSVPSVNQNVKFTWEKQLNDECDIQTFLKTDAGSFVDQPRKAFLDCMENDQDDRIQQLKDVIRDDLQKTPIKKEMGEFWYAEDHLMDLDPCKCLVYEQSEKLCSELESHWIGVEKTEPWWRNADKDELASLVSNKKLEQFENCDLPRPQSKHYRSGPSNCLQCFDQDRVLASSDQKAKKEISSLVAHTRGTPTSGSMGETQCIMGGVQCLPSSSDRLFSRHDGFDTTEADVAEKLQRLDSDLTKAQLLEALCHSQTRAREAEKAAQQAYDEKEHIIKLFFRQASHLFAYRQWLQILQIETLCLQLKNNKDQPILAHLPAFLPLPTKGWQLWKGRGKAAKRKVQPPKYKMSKCVVAFAVGFSLASAGLLLGWTLGWLFPAL